MKIGILTYHRTLNYGGCLQALATRRILEDMGHDVYYIDYWPCYHKAYYDVISIEKLRLATGLKSKVKIVLDFLKYGRQFLRRKDSFEHFLKEQIYPYCKSLNEVFDIVIYGSDQIWRKQAALKSYNPIYFGSNNIIAKKHIAYSASMGILPQNDAEKKCVFELLKNLDVISVREKQLCDFLSNEGGFQSKVTLDPTLVVNREEWQKIVTRTSNYNKYILVYALHNVFNLSSIRKYAQAKGLGVKVLYGDVRKKESESVINTAGPYEFLSLIYNANMVFTSSFHGLCFSIIFEKEFYTSFENNSDRAFSLLEIAGLTDRFIEPNCTCPQEIHTINYDTVYDSINQYREDSLLFLKKNCR